MVAYTIEALSVILVEVPIIQGWPIFKALWDVVRVLIPLLRQIKHPDHPVEGLAGMKMEAGAYVLVSLRPWLVPDRMTKVFHVPRWCISGTDQRTEEQKWIVKNKCKTNYDNLATCLGTIWERIIELNFHTSGTTIG